MNGADFIQKLNRYSEEERRLYSKTYFITINISDYHTTVAHSNMLTILEQFLKYSLAIPAIDQIPIQKIIDLTTLFLNNNRFYYDNKIYRFIKGSPTSLSFSETLCHIYSLEWQKILLNELIKRNECYGQ